MMTVILMKMISANNFQMLTICHILCKAYYIVISCNPFIYLKDHYCVIQGVSSDLNNLKPNLSVKYIFLDLK